MPKIILGWWLYLVVSLQGSQIPIVRKRGKKEKEVAGALKHPSYAAEDVRNKPTRNA